MQNTLLYLHLDMVFTFWLELEFFLWLKGQLKKDFAMKPRFLDNLYWITHGGV